jgi:hypothetical protein
MSTNLSRRQLLFGGGMGLGTVALSALMAEPRPAPGR